MTRPSNSFIISVFIHLALALAVFFSYQYVKKGSHEKKEETLLCMKLSCRASSTPPVVTKKEKKIEKRDSKKVKKEIQKKKKKPIKKKEIPKKIITKVKKVDVKAQKIVIKEETLKELPKKTSSAAKLQTTTKVKKVLIAKVKPEKEYIDKNIERIIELLKENLYYPRRARKRGVEGKVTVSFTLSVDSKISNIKVLTSTHDILSRGAIQTIKNIDEKLPKPKESITFTVPISYKLK